MPLPHGGTVNVHLYPSQFLNESRILREASSVVSFGLFKRIDLVGMGGAGLASESPVIDKIRILRIGSRRDDKGLFGKLADALRWSWTVFRLYRRQPLGCVNCHSVSTLPLACALKWWTGAALVYDAHELETETSGLRGLRKLGTKLVEWLLIGYVDFSIFVGAAIEEWYRDRYALTRTAVVYNSPRYLDCQRSDRFRETFSIGSDTPIFLYQGVLSEARGVPKLIEAFSQLEGVALVIMGYGELEDCVARRAEQRPNLYYHPAVPPETLFGYTSSADYGLSVIEAVSLSYEYCMPNKLFEYLMAGMPVLVSPTREQRALVERYDVGIVLESTSVQAIRQGVRELLQRELSSFADSIERVRKDFAWERQVEVLRGIYVEKLGLRRG